MSKAVLKKKAVARVRGGERTIAAGEYKAKCLRIMHEVRETGQSVIVTKRGEPMVRVSPVEKIEKKVDDLFGDLAGVIEIVGDPDDLIRPAYALEEYDMFR